MALWGHQVGLCGVLGVPSGAMGPLKGSLWGYGNPKWDYGVLSGVMGSLKGSSWRYGDPKWGYGVSKGGSTVLWGPSMGLCGVMGSPVGL